MKFFNALVVFFLLSATAFAQSYSISGVVKEGLTDKPIIHATVGAGSVTGYTNDDGSFRLHGIAGGKYTLIVTMAGYETLSVPVTVADGPADVGKLQMQPSRAQGESGVAEITIGDDGDENNEAVSGLLHSSDDIFVNTSSYTFSSMFFRPRGYDSEYETVLIDGIPFNDAETGRAVWGEWGGLNDVMRNREYINGLQPGNFSLGNLGGSSYITTRASKQRKQTKLSYSLSNRSYTNRIMFTYSTGMMKNDWAVTVSGSRRWSEEGYVEGTFYDAYACFLGVEKKINSRHSLSFSGFASPTRRGMNSASVQEVYDLVGSNYYNANWGYQNGDKRNARIRTVNEPKLILSEYWTIDEKTTLTTSLSYSFGKTGTTGLNWYNSRDPRPDYYRNLPNYMQDPTDTLNSVVQAAIIDAWKNDPSVSQIDWNRLYQTNYLANLEGKQARYILENNITAQNQWYLTSRINRQTGEHSNFSGGIELNHYKGSHYKILEDLLGGKYWVDIDQFSERDFKTDKEKLQNDLNNPNRVIREGDRFGYNYDLLSNTANLWGLLELNYPHFDYYIGAAFGGTQYWREGFMRNGRNPDNSYGVSEKQSTLTYDIKAGSTWKVTGRHFVTANAAYIMRPPLLRDAYISPRTGADLTPGITDEKILSGDISYVARFPNFNARVTLYETFFKDYSKILRFYADDFETYVNMALTGVDRIHQGIEFGAETKIIDNLKLVTVASFGNYRYTNRPKATINYDNGSEPDTTETVYAKYFYLGGTPQFAGSVGLKYNKNYWFFDLDVNYYDRIWLDFNPMRRTQAAIANLGEGDPLIELITEQEQLDGGFTVDASIGKSIRINYKYFVNINFSVNNILDNTSLISGGYEQNRFDYTHEYLQNGIDKFPGKYYYSYGRTFFLNVGFRF
ncbi:MAG TPA: carboxypeptidase-like regulatory domain-containing protein [Bacteroidales bacterium]|nr:carboxypeptidase-like regulatory domain-containing protein [Bacteroidales bacterium]HPT02010.1 carboxypeptidase-like regulatory domain-containing protein [Bacteroidales bacterium]